MKKFTVSGTTYRCYPCTAISNADNGNEAMRQDAVLVISTGDAEQSVEVVFGYELPQGQADFAEMCGDSAAWESDQETLRSVRCPELGSGLEPWKAHVWY